MKNSIIILFSTILCMFIACNKGIKQEKFGLTAIDTSYLNKDAKELIKRYINKNSQYKSFTLIRDFSYDWDENRGQGIHTYLIGPSYKGMCFGGEESLKTYPSHFFFMDSSVVFVQTTIDRLYNQEGMGIIYKHYEVPMPLHTSSEHAGKSALLLYMSKAMAFQICGHNNSVIFKTERADTFILKRRINFTPPKVAEIFVNDDSK